MVTTASCGEANVVYSGGLCGEGTYRTSFRTPRAAPLSLASARCYGNSPNPPPQMLQAAWSTLNSVREIEKEREITTVEKDKNCCSEKGEGVHKRDWPKKEYKLNNYPHPHPQSNLIFCIGLGCIGPRALLCSLGTLLPNFRLHSIIYLLHQTPSNVQASRNAYGISRVKYYWWVYIGNKKQGERVARTWLPSPPLW